MRFLLTIAMAIAIAPLPASEVLAGDATTPSAVPVRPAASLPVATAAVTTPALGFEWDSVFPGAGTPLGAGMPQGAGRAAQPGDYSRTVRPFGDWTQVCDDVRGGRHLCYVETIARKDGLSIGWRIARTRDGRSMALIILPRDASVENGVTVEFGEMSRTAKPLICDKTLCVATFPVDGPMLSLFARQTAATIYFRRSGNPVSIVAGLRGMSFALVDLMPKTVAQKAVAQHTSLPRQDSSATSATVPVPAKKQAPSPWQGAR